MKAAHKLTLGQDLQITGGRATETLLRSPPDRWISDARVTQYQVLLLHPPHITFSKAAILNPATLLPDDDPEEPRHECREVLDTLTGPRPDLIDTSLAEAKIELFTDGSSYLKDGARLARAAVTTQETIIWAQALPQGTSAQKAELIALAQALRWAKGKTANIHTDSRYAFATAHAHGALYQERGLLTSNGKEIKNKEEILALLEAIWLPQKVAIIHCRGHQKGKDPITQGNSLADRTAREAATKPLGPLEILPNCLRGNLPILQLY